MISVMFYQGVAIQKFWFKGPEFRADFKRHRFFEKPDLCPARFADHGGDLTALTTSLNYSPAIKHDNGKSTICHMKTCIYGGFLIAMFDSRRVSLKMWLCVAAQRRKSGAAVLNHALHPHPAPQMPTPATGHNSAIGVSGTEKLCWFLSMLTDLFPLF